jgi:DNA-binding response OmpR family regulator
MNRILVVDDEPDIVELVHDILTGNGFEVYTANSGEEALNMLDTVMPDLIVLDIVLPGLSGLELCRKIKSKSSLANIRVLFLTVLGRPVDHSWMEDAGCDGYLLKPFEKKELLQKVDAMLSSDGENNL